MTFTQSFTEAVIRPQIFTLRIGFHLICDQNFWPAQFKYIGEVSHLKCIGKETLFLFFFFKISAFRQKETQPPELCSYAGKLKLAVALWKGRVLGAEALDGRYEIRIMPENLKKIFGTPNLSIVKLS